MDNQEFQKIVLEELRSLKEGQKNLETGQKNLEERQKNLEERQKNLEERQKNLEFNQENLIERFDNLQRKVDAIHEQTIQLTEFRQEANDKFDKLFENNRSITEILGEHEIEIRNLRRRSIR